MRSYFARKGLNINVAMELSSHEAIKVAVAEGFGLAIIARRWLANELALNMISVIDVPDLKLSIEHGVIVGKAGLSLEPPKPFCSSYATRHRSLQQLFDLVRLAWSYFYTNALRRYAD